MRSRQYVTDGELGDADHDLDCALRLRDGGPWGAAFEAPLFHGVYRIVDQRIVGSGHLKMSVRPVAGRTVIEAMWFRRDCLLETDRCYRLVFRLAVNEFRGTRRANLSLLGHRGISAFGKPIGITLERLSLVEAVIANLDHAVFHARGESFDVFVGRRG